MMNTQSIKYILAGIALTAFHAHTCAQQQPNDSTLNRTVVVEQEYNPDILDAAKINKLPRVEPPTAVKREVEYNVTAVPARQIPATVMQAYTGKETQRKARPGYARIGYGNYGNLDAYADYLFTLSDNDRLNLNFQMDGMDGDIKQLLNGGSDDWRSYYYRTHAGADYRHNFRKAELNVAGDFSLSNFNFLPDGVAHKQKFSSGSFHIGSKSTDADAPISFLAETNLLFYSRQSDLAYSDLKETQVHTRAEVTGALSDAQRIGIGMTMDNVFYGKNSLESYTSITLNPHYLLENDDWHIRAGAHVDFAFGFGKKFRVAPDVTVAYNFSDSYILYAQAQGGKQQNDFRRLEQFCPYGQIPAQADATYEQLNAAIGFKASPANGWWLHLYGGYQNLKNDLFLLPYQGALAISQWNTDNLYAGIEVSYDYKELVSLTAGATYRNWNAAHETLLADPIPVLGLKPALESGVQIGLHPLSALQVNVGYRHLTRSKVEGYRMDAASNLYLGGSYEFLKGISVYLRMNNLLNKSYQPYWGYFAEGFNLVGGVSFTF